VLVIPKKHIAGLKEATVEDADLLGHCHLAAAEMLGSVRRMAIGLYERRSGAGQSVFHMHALTGRTGAALAAGDEGRWSRGQTALSGTRIDRRGFGLRYPRAALPSAHPPAWLVYGWQI
jgi:diadenosine tetraphosphate (Ap4A) HIT family hydrolase